MQFIAQNIASTIVNSDLQLCIQNKSINAECARVHKIDCMNHNAIGAVAVSPTRTLWRCSIVAFGKMHSKNT